MLCLFEGQGATEVKPFKTAVFLPRIINTLPTTKSPLISYLYVVYIYIYIHSGEGLLLRTVLLRGRDCPHWEAVLTFIAKDASGTP